MIDDEDEDDYEGYFLRPANEYNIKEKIKQANQESFAIPTPPSPRYVAGERRVTFREQLVDYEPDGYSSEEAEEGQTEETYQRRRIGGGSKMASGGTVVRRGLIETVADVHRECPEDVSPELEEIPVPPSPSMEEEEEEEDEEEEEMDEEIIEELHIHERPEAEGQILDAVDDEEEDEEEQTVEYEEEEVEKHKTGVEGEVALSEEDEEEVEEEATESSLDTEIHNPGSSEEISSPMKTYRSEADSSRSENGSGESQNEETVAGSESCDHSEQQEPREYGSDDEEEDDEDDSQDGGGRGVNGHGDAAGDPDHQEHRSAKCRRKCCRHKRTTNERLPYYNGYHSEYGLSREELEAKKSRQEARRQRHRERHQRRIEEQLVKAQCNEEAFASWLHNKLKNSINKHQNLYDQKGKPVRRRRLQRSLERVSCG